MKSGNMKAVLIDVSDQLWPILDACSHVSAHDVVVLLVADPGALNVIDLEFDVGRDPS